MSEAAIEVVLLELKDEQTLETDENIYLAAVKILRAELRKKKKGKRKAAEVEQVNADDSEGGQEKVTPQSSPSPHRN
jgi:hypothetical protein